MGSKGGSGVMGVEAYFRVFELSFCLVCSSFIIILFSVHHVHSFDVLQL